SEDEGESRSPYLVDVVGCRKTPIHCPLEQLGNPQTAPTRPDRIPSVLTRLAQHGTQRAASRRQIHTVQTVKANRPLQVARTQIIHFTHFIPLLREKFRIFPPFDS